MKTKKQELTSYAILMDNDKVWRGRAKNPMTAIKAEKKKTGCKASYFVQGYDL